MLNWESTDNFGNLSVATSAAADLDALTQELASMIEVVFARTPENVRFVIDLEYGEIAAPDPNQVTHILGTPLIGTLQSQDGSDSAFAQISAAIGRALGGAGKTAEVVRA